MRSRFKLLAVAGLLVAGALGVSAASVFGGEGDGAMRPVDRVVHVEMRPAKPGEVPRGVAAASARSKKKKKIKLTYDYSIATQPVPVPASPSVARPSTTTAIIECRSKFRPISGGLSSAAGTPLVESASSHFDPATGAVGSSEAWYERVNNTSPTAQTFRPTLVCLKLS
jgi:hypothetical protein